MCTTDPQKIPPTILSRVQRFDFHAIGADEMQAHLAYVCAQEGFTYDGAALELVVRHARGGMRDALTALEQLSVFGNGRIGLDEARDLLGEVSGSVLADLARAMAHRDVPTLFSAVSHLADAGRDTLQLTRELTAHLRDVYVVAVAPSADDVVAARGAELDELRAEAAAFGSADRVARALTILGDASSEMRTAPNQRLVLEIALTRVARPESDLTLESLAERVADLERQVALLARPGATSVVTAPDASQVTSPVLPDAIAPMNPSSAAAPTSPNGVGLSVAGEKGTAGPAPKAAPDSTAVPAPTSAATPAATPALVSTASAGLSEGDLQRAWKRVVDELVASIPAKGSLLLSSTPVSDDGEKVTVSLPKGSHFAARMLERADVRSSVDGVVASVMGPRQVIYVESSLSSQAIAQASRPVPSRPAPRPASQPTPRPESAPAFQSSPQPPASTYPMPWDEPASLASQPPADDAVPYDDADAASFDEAVEDAPTAAPASVPTAQNRQSTDAVEPSPVPRPAPILESAAQPQKKVATQVPPSAIQTPQPEAQGQGPVVAPADLGPEFASIVSMLSETFGQQIPAHYEPADATSDEEAAAELAEDVASSDSPASDAGFVDEPFEDGDEGDD